MEQHINSPGRSWPRNSVHATWGFRFGHHTQFSTNSAPWNRKLKFIFRGWHGAVFSFLSFFFFVLKSSFVHMFWSLGCSGFYFQWVKRQHLTILITTLSVVLNCCLVLLSFIGIGG